jgi:sulfite exporter TauE/SafE
MESFIANGGLILAYILIGAAALAAFGFSLVQLVTNFERGKFVLIGIGALLVIFGIAFAISGSETEPYQNVPQEIDASTSRLVGAMLKTMYISGGLAIVGIIVSEVAALFR